MADHVWNIREEKALRLLGRYNPALPVFRAHWAGSGVELRIRCTRLEIELEAGSNDQTLWVIAMADGAPFARFAVEPGRRWYTVTSGMEAGVEHTISILRETQPMSDASGLALTMHALRSDGELLPLEDKAMTIEFVGDSLTTGEGLIGPQSAQEWRTVWFSSYSYSHMVAQALNARRRLVSQSGWGVYTSWDNDRGGVLSRIYDDVCRVGDADVTPYDFAADPAALVVINLGTNDGNAMSQMRPKEKAVRRKEVENAAVALMQQVRAHNPQAQILWVYGMCGHVMAPVLKRAVERARQSGDAKVAYLSLPNCKQVDMGSRWHPGVRNHQKAANAIIAWVKENMA